MAGLAAPFAAMEAPFDAIVGENGELLGVRSLGRASVASRAWQRVFGCARLLLRAVERQARVRGTQPPPGFGAAVRDGDARRALLLSRYALRRRLLVVGADAAEAVRWARPFPLGRTRSLTTFVVVNESGVDVWVHFIQNDHRSPEQPCGRVVSRPGDLVPSSRSPLAADDGLPRVFPRVAGGATEPPAGVFVHTSTLSHAFAMCLVENGPPLAVYQQRRAFLEMRTRHWRQSHVHALRLIPAAEGFAIEELVCVQRIPLHPGDAGRVAHFQATASLDSAPSDKVVEPGLVPARDGRLRPRFRSAPAPVKTYDRLAAEIAGLPLPRSVDAWPSEARTIVNFVLGRDDTSYSHSPACPLDLTHLAARVEGQQFYEDVWRAEDTAFFSRRPSPLGDDDASALEDSAASARLSSCSSITMSSVASSSSASSSSRARPSRDASTSRVSSSSHNRGGHRHHHHHHQGHSRRESSTSARAPHLPLFVPLDEDRPNDNATNNTNNTNSNHHSPTTSSSSDAGRAR